jgi:hypothetical protein
MKSTATLPETANATQAELASAEHIAASSSVRRASAKKLTELTAKTFEGKTVSGTASVASTTAPNP